MPVDITLSKAKYRDPARRGPKGQQSKGRTGNSHGPTPKRQKGGQGTGHRRKSYGGPR